VIVLVVLPTIPNWSVAWKVATNAPGTVGTPDNVPFVFSVTPGGKSPAVLTKVYGGVPPEAVSTALKNCPTVAAGGLKVTVTGEVLLIVIVVFNVPTAPLLSVPSIETAKAPTLVGVPDKVPLRFSVKPSGKLPATR
jgi:hypothetical protein